MIQRRFTRTVFAFLLLIAVFVSAQAFSAPREPKDPADIGERIIRFLKKLPIPHLGKPADDPVPPKP